MLGFGQRVGQVIQTAFVVENLRASIDNWIRDTGAGPWFVMENLLQPGQIYRGQASTANACLAFGYSGHLQIELIQPKDDNPSVYRETIKSRGYGFHHVAIASADVDADIRRYEAKGYELAFRVPSPTGGALAYLDGGDASPRFQSGFLELLPVTAAFDQLFSSFWQAAQDWDGTDPVRIVGTG